MRITNSMMTDNYLYNLNGNLNRLSKYLEQETSGKKINSISDDPVGVTKSLLARNRLSGTERYQDNVKTAGNWLTEVESSLSELDDVIGSAYESAVEAATGTYNGDDLDDIAEEIAQLRDEVLSTANTTMGNSYLFAGYNTTGTDDGTQPFMVDSCGDLYYNGINMSNEASADYIAEAADSAAGALSEAKDANTLARTSDLSERNKIIAAVQKAAGYVRQISDAAATASDGAKDIAASSGVAGTTMNHLLSDASDASRTAAKEAAGAASNVLGLADAAQAAADAEDKAYAAWQKAVGSDGESDAHNAYLDAQTAADTALQAALGASADALLKAGTAKAATDTVSSIVGARDSFVSAAGSAAGAAATAQTAYANSDYGGVADAADSASELANTAAQAAQVFAGASSVIGSTAAGDIADAISTLMDKANAASAAAAAVTDGPTASAAMSAIDDVRQAISDLEDCVGGYVDGYDELHLASSDLDGENEDVIAIQVGSGHTMALSAPGTELLGRGSENLYVILDDFYHALKNGDDVSGYIDRLQGAQNRTLSLDAEIGAKMDRLDTLSTRYTANVSNYTQMRSDAEDVDMAEAIMNYSTANTVYNAALAAGSQVIQTSLIDFLK